VGASLAQAGAHATSSTGTGAGAAGVDGLVRAVKLAAASLREGASSTPSSVGSRPPTGHGSGLRCVAPQGSGEEGEEEVSLPRSLVLALVQLGALHALTAEGQQQSDEGTRSMRTEAT
jgi:hypothetical protein